MGLRGDAAAYQREYETVKALTKEARRAHMRAWRMSRPDFAWPRKTRQERIVQMQTYRLKNSERCSQLTAAWRARNPARAKASIQAWRAANREAVRVYAQNRRSRVGDQRISRGLPGRLFITQGGLCRYCRADLAVVGYTMDHIIPLARGGPHCDENIQLTCKSCNSKKRDKMPEEFERWLAADA